MDAYIHMDPCISYLYARDGNARALRRFKGLPVHNKPLYSSLGLTSVEDYDYCTRGGCTEVLTVASPPLPPAPACLILSGCNGSPYHIPL